MGDEFRKASTLDDVPRVASLQPLPLGDRRYADLSAGRGSDALTRLRIKVQDAARLGDARLGYDHIAFTGHRGCGKTTELLRLQHEVSAQFTPLHLYADEALLSDYDYTYLFLWLVDSLVGHFAGILGGSWGQAVICD